MLRKKPPPPPKQLVYFGTISLPLPSDLCARTSSQFQFAYDSKAADSEKSNPVWEGHKGNSDEGTQETAKQQEGLESTEGLDQEKEKVTPFKKRKATRRPSPVVETQLCDLEEEQLSDMALMSIGNKKSKGGPIARKESQVQKDHAEEDVPAVSKDGQENKNPSSNAE